MDLLIIGGTRFVGYLLAWRSIAAGRRVTLLNRGTRPDPFGARVERLTGDRTVPADVRRLLAGRRFDAVVDFAAYGPEDVAPVIEFLGTEGVGHYVLISTGQVYLVREGCPTPSRESDYAGPTLPEPTNPEDHGEWLYGIRKRAAEELLDEAWRAHGFPATRLRIPMVNGERDYYRRIDNYLWRVLDGGPVLLPDGGRQVCRHVYGAEVVRAIDRVLGDADTFGQAYNICQEEEPTVADVVALLAELLGAPARLVSVASEQLVAAGVRPVAISPFSGRWMSHIDPTRARTELGFRHQPLRDYLATIVTCFLAHPPAEPPDSYAHRETERRLAERGTAI